MLGLSCGFLVGLGVAAPQVLNLMRATRVASKPSANTQSKKTEHFAGRVVSFGNYSVGMSSLRRKSRAKLFSTIPVFFGSFPQSFRAQKEPALPIFGQGRPLRH